MEELLRQFKYATDVLEAASIDYVVFGGIAVWAYGRRRKTKDIDLLIRREDAKRTLDMLGRAGFLTEETDHRWLYKASLDHSDIDLIFEARGDIKLTPEILGRARQMNIAGVSFRVMDPENLVMMKILAAKEIRPADWYDALSVIENAADFDWHYVIGKAGKYIAKYLSFVFFAESTYGEKTGGHIIPPGVIDDLIDIYQRGNSSSKIA
ncbi:MAG: nucleotidyltransferase [Actinomycetota bacterium]|nr:nucleotidyltransferase [Actinomycetota bacterium]